MNKGVGAGVLALFAGCMIVNARIPHTGHLIVAMTDIETGRPITNATVTVRCQTKFSLSHTLESFFTKTSAHSNSNGVAHVEFTFFDEDFDWWIDAPSHYTKMFGFGCGTERFGRVVEESDYANINTNTVDGLSKYNELVNLYNADYLAYMEKFNPKSVVYTNKVVCRTVVLTPKHNPQPMYAYGDMEKVYLPIKNPTTFITNGVEVTRYQPVDFDLKECDLVSEETNQSEGQDVPTGKIADFHLERFTMITNGEEITYGWMEFAPGGGAYIIKKPGNGYFPVIYEANTNAVFLSRIPFEYSYTNGWLKQASQKILDKDECMVLKTRAVTDGLGVVTNCNYSKIMGPMSILKVLTFEALIFNPRPNDPNLEFDVKNNLSEYDYGCGHP